MFDSGHWTTHAWGHTSDWCYGRGVPVHVPKHVFDSGQSTIHADTPLTGVKALGSPGHSRESHGSLRGALQESHGKSLGLGTPGSHGSLWGWALQRVSQ